MVALPAGAAAYLAINKTPCVLFARRLAARIRLTPPGDQQALSLYPILDYCGPRDAGHVIDVAPVEPSERDVFAGH